MQPPGTDLNVCDGQPIYNNAGVTRARQYTCESQRPATPPLRTQGDRLSKLRNRPGFTLAEILVMLAILGILTAVLVPTVTMQIRKGDISAVSGDLTNIRGGIEAFLADVRRYPAEVNDLVTKSTVDTDVNGNAIPSGLLSGWNGPYIDRIDVGTGMATGFGGNIVSAFDTVVTNGNSYLTIDVTGIVESDFVDIDEVIDGSANSSTGRLRWTADASGTVRYLALPIN